MKNIFINIKNTIKERIRIKWVVIFCSVQIVVILISLSLFGILPVNREHSRISEEFNLKSAATANRPDNSELLMKVRERDHYDSYLRSALALSRTDSITLLIDLSDSLAILSLKGVFLFQSKLSEIKFNKGLQKLPVYLRDSLYSGPAQVKTELASIEKFPVVVKKAPKDTTEANAAESAPVLPVQNDVFIMFAFDNNLVIEFNQQEREFAGSKRAYRKYKKEYNRFFRSHNAIALKDKEAPTYLYRLQVSLPREDARSIYRALPIKPYILVRY